VAVNSYLPQVSKISSQKKASQTNLLVAKIAAMHVKMLADHNVKCSMQFALHAANHAKFLSSLGTIARYIAAIALRNKDNLSLKF
jgi:hypothetical protein